MIFLFFSRFFFFKGAVKTKGILDYETTPVVEFRVRVSDSGSPPLSADTVALVRVHVEDVNDTPPHFSSLYYNTTLHLPTYRGVAVAQVNATDPDSPRDSLRFEIARGNEDGAFKVNVDSSLSFLLLLFFLTKHSLYHLSFYFCVSIY
jgi:hypothetical protein